MELRGKVVIVTGASSGVGAATARLAHGHGARLVLAARRADRLVTLSQELAGSLAVPTDVTSGEAVRRLCDRALAEFGAIDVLVNNAGQGLHVPLMSVEPSDFQAVWQLNVMAPLALMQAVFPTMAAQGSGAIVNVSSGTSVRVIPGLGAYAATKAALNMLSQVARAEFADKGVTVSLVFPGITDTDFHQSLRAGTFRGPSGVAPELVAETILQAIASGEPEVRVPYPG
ncbi:MAG TPA: SDR family oxidoreductase [Candidatus Dormibacteraeota bacterium]|nr:SDR family oxidoreductase [Candidatus Dormibacteraeota bacterium]